MSGRAKSGIKATDAKGAPRSAAAQGIESAAALAATTGVFLAGAVSGAVAKVVDDRARSDAAQVQPADPADDQSQLSHAAAPQSPEPNDQSDTVAAIATADTAGGVSSAAETFAADPAARGSDPAALQPHADARQEPVQDIERGLPPSASHTVSTTTDTADVDVAHHVEAVSQPVVPEEQQDTSHNAPPATQPLIEAIAGSATSDLGQAFQKLTTLVESLETKQAQLTERLDQTVGTLGDAIEARVDTVLSEATTKLDTALERLDGSLETTLAKVTDIPQSLLGADHDAGSGGGLLATLFGDDGDPIALPTATPEDDAPTSAIAALNIDLPDLSSTIDAVKIGFSGQSYSDAGGDFDGPAGAHGNLLHGLL